VGGGWVVTGGWKANKSVIFREFAFLTSLGGKKWGGGQSHPSSAVFEVPNN